MPALTTRTPDFAGVVSKVTYESGTSPAGMLSQFDLWITIAPSSTPSAGVVIPASGQVFVRTGTGSATPSTACLIKLGDQVQIWHTGSAGYGSVEAPPASPVYFGTQIVIVR